MSRLYSSPHSWILLLSLIESAAASAAPVPAARNATGSAIVLRSLSILRNANLEFGSLVVSGAGTAVIDPVSGTMTTAGAVAPFGGSAHPAAFTGTGSRNSVVLIRIPQKPITLTRIGGTETMTVSDWTLDGNKNRKIPPSQAFTFAVGATLNVNAGQAEGIYAGTFDVTVQYP